MKHLLLAGVAVIIGITYSAPLHARDAAAGEKVFQREKCSLCHTATRNSLKEVGSKLTAEQIREWITNPKAAGEKAKSTAKPPMRSFEKLPKTDIDNLVAYLQTLKAPAK